MWSHVGLPHEANSSGSSYDREPGLIAEMIDFMTVQSRIAGRIGVLSQSVIGVVRDSSDRYTPTVKMKFVVLSAGTWTGLTSWGRIPAMTG